MKGKGEAAIDQPQGASTGSLIPGVAGKNGVPALGTNTIDFSGDANKGMEGADKASYAIPFLVVLQKLSPQIDTVPFAVAGKLMNNVTNELFDEAFVVPCAFQRMYLRWAPRDDGGGFKGMLKPEDVETGKIEGITKDEENPFVMILEGDELKDTRMHYVLVYSAKSDTWLPAMLSLGSTQIKKSKRWMTQIQSIELRNAEKVFTPPSYSHVYSIKTVKEQNDSGQWFGVDIQLVGPLGDQFVYAKAKKFHQDIAAGQVEITTPEAEDATATGATKGGF